MPCLHKILPSLLAVVGVVLASYSAVATTPAQRANLFPRLREGQSLVYQLSYSSSTRTKTQSALAVAAPENTESVALHAAVHLDVLAVRIEGDREAIRARAQIEMLDSNDAANSPPSAPSGQQEKSVDFAILPDGKLAEVTGLEALTPDQQRVWQEWAAKFSLCAALPGTSAKIQQKWKSREPEQSTSPIAGLGWARESTYVRDTPCRVLHESTKGEPIESNPYDETCAVILTTATLTQASSSKDATPEDFKLHQLHTSGTASGTNKIISYVSLKTGLVVRTTEDAHQTMSVTIAKADKSNRVHYDVNATSQSEILLIEQPHP